MATIYPNRKNGKITSFKFKAYLGRDQNGKQMFKCTTWTPEKTATESKLMALAQKQAILWESELQADFEAEKSTLTPQQITFKKFVEEKWLPIQEEYRNSTIVFRRSLVRKIIDYLGEFNLQDIDSKKIAEYLDYLKNYYRTQQNKPVSQQTQRHHYSTLNLIFEYAMKLGFINTNPMSSVKTPKLTRHKVDALSKEEAQFFVKEIENLSLQHRLIYTLLLTTGVRRGECFGLKWGDLDLCGGIMHVERNVTYTTAHGTTVGLPKTSTGIRDIPITNSTIELIKEYKREEEKTSPISKDMYLFHSESSRMLPRDPTYITKHMKRFMKRMGLPNMSPHDLRHTCASLLLQSGADIKSVQDILGHANASTTLNYYAKSNINTMRAAAARAFDF